MADAWSDWVTKRDDHTATVEERQAAFKKYQEAAKEYSGMASNATYSDVAGKITTKAEVPTSG